MSGCTHVYMISKQPMPNLIPLLHEKPERAFFFNIRSDARSVL